MNTESYFCIRSSDYEVYNHKVNGTISYVKKLYDSYRVSYRQLLSDYNDVITTPELRERALNPWQYVNEDRKKNSVVCGATVLETAFNLGAMKLYKQKPIDVIKGIYYSSFMDNESGLEKVFINSILDQLTSESKVLIVNPSPFAIECLVDAHKNCKYYVPDRVLSNLYSKQYPHLHFEPIEALLDERNADVMIAFMTRINDEIVNCYIEAVRCGIVPKILCLMESKLIDNKKSVFWNALSTNYYSLRDIIIVPKEISVSPSRKAFVSLVRESENKSILIQKIEYDSFKEMVSLSAKSKELELKNLYENYKTIHKWWSSDDLKEERTPIYSTAYLYPFSKEIYILYSIYEEDNGFYGKAYYAETKNPQMPMYRGKALTKRIEKGLRAETKEGVRAGLELIPYCHAVSEAIRKDIAVNYLDAGIPITLKSLWFCFRSDLLTNTSYDDVLMKSVFTGNTSISGLLPNSMSIEQLENAIKEQLNEGEEVKEVKILKQLNLIIDEAIKKGYLSENRVLPMIPSATNRASKRQSDIRQALAKRSFEDIEEERIVKLLKSRYKETSLYLAVLIRLFTGIPNREVCGLLWEDFSYDSNTEVYKLTINKFVNAEGKLVSHALKEDWDKYRVLPISSFLGEIITARKDYLLEQGVNEKFLADNPIVLQRENIAGLIKGYQAKFCKPSAVALKCREAVSSAEIPQRNIILPGDGIDLEVDINNYNGDIFRTNFRDKAINKACFRLDELHYYLGIKKPDTFSRHYCDYTNDYVQMKMANKAELWTCIYVDKRKNSNLSADDLNSMSSIGIGDGVPSIEIDINNATNNPISTLKIEVDCKHEFKIIVT